MIKKISKLVFLVLLTSDLSFSQDWIKQHNGFDSKTCTKKSGGSCDRNRIKRYAAEHHISEKNAKKIQKLSDENLDLRAEIVELRSSKKKNKYEKIAQKEEEISDNTKAIKELQAERVK